MMTGTFLGARLGLQCGVGRSHLPSDAVGRSGWRCLAVDVLLDDRQRCASVGYEEVGRRLKVSVDAGADTGSGELRPHQVDGATFHRLRRDRRSWRVGEKQAHVVGLAGELVQLVGELAVHRMRGVLAKGRGRIGEHWMPLFGHEFRVGVQHGHAAAEASLGVGCQWSVLRLWCADALPVPDRTDTDPTADAGSGVGNVAEWCSTTRCGCATMPTGPG
jgi:hypothetical protein